VAKDTTIKITTVEIQMGAKTIALTIEQARVLKQQLEDLFGVKVVNEHHYHHEPHTTYIPWTKPYLLDEYVKTIPPKGLEVWCASSDPGNAKAMLCVQ
jgi:hypothetical protein